MSVHDTVRLVLGSLGTVGNASAALAGILGERLRAWRLEPVYQDLDNYMQTGDAEMIGHIKRLFGPRRAQ
jgi:hypothetical protein